MRGGFGSTDCAQIDLNGCLIIYFIALSTQFTALLRDACQQHPAPYRTAPAMARSPVLYRGSIFGVDSMTRKMWLSHASASIRTAVLSMPVLGHQELSIMNERATFFFSLSPPVTARLCQRIRNSRLRKYDMSTYKHTYVAAG